MIKRDNIHYSTRKIDGYNLPFNFVISERELGKSTTIILDKILIPFTSIGIFILLLFIISLIIAIYSVKFIKEE